MATEEDDYHRYLHKISVSLLLDGWGRVYIPSPGRESRKCLTASVNVIMNCSESAKKKKIDGGLHTFHHYVSCAVSAATVSG